MARLNRRMVKNNLAKVEWIKDHLDEYAQRIQGKTGETSKGCTDDRILEIIADGVFALADEMGVELFIPCDEIYRPPVYRETL